MFMSFGKKNSSSKKITDSPKTTSPSRVSSTDNGNVSSEGSRATVQTVAGPLLASTRFNTTLDASTYANVNSPGFTSRVVNCASNRSPSHHGSTATHQAKYSSIGLFPRVQLAKHSILPTLSPRISQKVSRAPVRVRIAAPSLSERRRYSISGGSNVEIRDRVDVLKRSPSLSCHSSTKDHPSPPRVTNSCNVPEGIAETSRKRIFSECQDAWDEAKKRRKKTELPIPNPNDDMYQYRHVRAPAVPSGLPHSDISSQGKRAREKGSPEEQKRQRRKICNNNNAIFSSLSSSRNLMERLCTPKRKSADMSRSSSPLTPLGGKHVKENKTVTSAKGVQCNLDEDRCQTNLTDARQQDSTPLSTKGIVKRSINNIVHETNRSSSNSQQVPACDYTTKLFRKDVSVNSPRTPVSKEKKPGLWVQPPEADELSCSLVDGDSEVDRPERLKSLLACVSGKEKNPVANQTTANVPATIEVTKPTIQSTFGHLSPANVNGVPTSAIPSPSSAVTVTVSSTCTIMTSATVTSVNGVPSSESSPPPLQPSQTPTSSSIASPSLGFKLTNSSSPSLFGQNLMKVPVPHTSPSSAPKTGLVSSSLTVMTQNVSNASAPGTPDPASSLGSSASTSASFLASNLLTSSGSFGMQSKESPTVTSSSNLPTFPSIQTDSVKNQTTSNQSDTTTASQSSLSLFSMKSPIQSSSILGSSTVPSTDTSKPSFQFGSNNNNIPSISKPSFQFGTGDGNVSVSTKSCFQFGSSKPVSSSSEKTKSPTQSAFQLVSAAKPSENSNSSTLSNTTSAFSQPQFGSNLSAVPNPAFSFSPSGNAALAAKPVLQFGSNSNVGEIQKPPFQFSTNGGSLNEGSKATMNFTSNGCNAALQSKPTFSFGSNGSGSSEPPKTTFQFGSSNTSSSEASKPSLSFGSASNTISGGSKPAFQFGSSSTGALKPAFQFGPGSNGTSEASKPAFQFNSSPAVNSSKPAFNVASNLDKSSDPLKPSFQFSANTIEKSQSFPTPTFGSPLQSSSSAFGQVAPQQSKSAFTFGSSAAPSIGASTGSQSKGGFSFGSTGPAFGSTSSTTTANFGNSSTFASVAAPAFGSSTSNAQSPPSSFGSVTEPKTNGFAPPDFRSSASNAQSPPSSFGSVTEPKSNGFAPPAFGSSASNAQSPPSTFGSVTEPKTNGFGPTAGFGGSTSFSFNSSSTSGSAFQFSDKNSASSGNGSFTFGQNADQASSAFSFNGAVSAVPNGSAPVSQPTGLFSIGAGPSSTQRRIARRKR